ncbi:MAG: hypothetical protein H7Z75_18900 [Ferruginibacter sp.]|nr:hypothetical protein [Cytophagales bacterium]
MYKKSLFLRYNGFHDHLQVVGGDDDLFVSQAASRTNVGVCLKPESFMVSIPKVTFREWFRQKKRHLSVGKHYKLRDKLLLGLLTLSQVGFWLSFPLLLVFGGQEYAAATVATFLIRMVALTVILDKIHRRLEARFGWYLIPVFDFLYIFYYLFTGTSAFFAKKIRWN